MDRTLFVWGMLFLFAMAGCGTKSSPVPDAAAASQATGTSVAEAVRPAPDNTSAQSAPSGGSAPPSAPPPEGLRILAAQYLESQGQGWRPNERAATELEK